MSGLVVRLAKRGIVHMKKLFGLVAVVALTMAMSLTVRAETINVFVSNIGTVTSFGKNADFTAMLHNNDMDFGYVCGPKSTGYFMVTDTDYTFDNVNVGEGYGGLHVFTYRTDRYELLKRYGKTSCTAGGIDACVVSNVVNHKVYSFVMPTATSFIISKTGLPNLSQLGLVTNVINACVAEYPDSKVVVGTALAWGDDMLRDYLSGEDSAVGLLAYSQPADWTGADCGAIYIEDAPDLDKANSSTQAIALSRQRESRPLSRRLSILRIRIMWSSRMATKSFRNRMSRTGQVRFLRRCRRSTRGRDSSLWGGIRRRSAR